MVRDKMQASRFEQKYVVSEDTALQIRDFVLSYLELDENGVGKPDFSYPVHSLYLDSDDFKLYWSTINGDKNRYKLRLRFYNDNPDTPIFFEIKRRMNNCIMKQRGAVRREAADLLMTGQLPDPEHLVARDPKHLNALERFCQLMQEVHATPKVHVAYLREAYVPHDDNSARLTMDRQVRVEARQQLSFETAMEHPVAVWGRSVVVELKFTNRFPEWFRELVRIFSLRQRGAAKYVDGVELLDEFGLQPRHHLRREAGSRPTALPVEETLVPHKHISS
jgi:SPX domain protein involved in polyphosphate accumulation